MTLAEELARGGPAITPARTAGLGFTARLHREALPEGFFPALGVPFLRAYHETFLASPHAVALIAWSDDRPAGFLVGTLANAEHYRWVLRHRGVALAWRGGLALLWRPALALHFLRTRSGRYARAIVRLAGRGAARTRPTRARSAARTRGDGSAPLPPERVAVLTHVAVVEDARGRGVGAALVEAFTDAAGARGARRAELVTTADSSGSQAFYRRCGWRKCEDRPDHDGRMVSRFARRLA